METSSSKRPNGVVTVAGLAAWETRTFPALRRQSIAARSTPVDDLLPLDPLAHLAELRVALSIVTA